ncbi:MAG: hypothetical protein IJW21_03760 [Clostridia bacterium]|nr:hypothetical protein [Clostridia bacterium]
MKITEVKEAMLENGFSDELFEEFKKALKRVPKGNRSGHLYTFAHEIAGRKNGFEGALKMINYVLEIPENHWVHNMRAYHALADIYESREMYAEAHDAYASALSAVPEEQRQDYTASISVRMMKVYLHIVNFSYTPHLRELYEAAQGVDGLEAGFRGVIYYTAIAEMIVSRHDGDKEAYSRAKSRALDALYGENASPVDIILARHRYKNEAHATDASICFLKKAK